MNQTLTIPDGFGRRLREERERLNLSQTELAAIGGVKRLAQSLYEKEASSPTVRYLAAVVSTGINLHYALFGCQTDSSFLSPAEQRRIEGKAFELLENFIQQQPGGSYGAEGRFALFQLIRTNLTQEALGKPADISISNTSVETD